MLKISNPVIAATRVIVDGDIEGISQLESLAEFIHQDLDADDFIISRSTLTYASIDRGFTDSDKSCLSQILSDGSNWYIFAIKETK